jgi:hypothetical protein
MERDMERTRRKFGAARTAQRGGLLKLILLIFSAAMMGTTAGFAADCVDNDGDGYAVCAGNCTLPSDKMCGDCDDSNPDIHPGATENCGDGIDKNCDGEVLAPGGTCFWTNVPAGKCPTPSVYTGNCDDGLTCADPGTYVGEVENLGNGQTCFDGIDNDCNGKTDLEEPACQTAEVCDGLDNDGDGVIDNGLYFTDATGQQKAVGEDCTVGLGACERTGKVICGPLKTPICSVDPGQPKLEALSMGDTCSDGIDNNCDGLVDNADPYCQLVASAEICDGIDNDLDGVIDNGFTFVDATGSEKKIGEECKVGLGACQRTGTVICKDASSATCSVSPGIASIEGPIGPSCLDGIDNDCDGLTDLYDPSCDAAAVQLRVQCALPYTVGQPGGDCNGKHLVHIKVLGNTSPALQVTGELLGLSPKGELLGILTDVRDGDEAHLASRMSPADFRMEDTINNNKRSHQVFAPVPLLHVVARDGDAEAEAYCSNIPYLDVIRPDGAVVSVSTGDTTKVTAAIPLVEPKSLVVMVDGVNILPDLGLDPMNVFPGGPYHGTANVHGQMVEVQDLIVVSSNGSIETLSSNTLTMTLKNLGGGGHIVYVHGDPIVMRNPLTEQCLMDDIADAGSVAALSVEITSPEEQEVIDPVPDDGIPIVGEVKHGRMIAGLKISGKPVDVSGQVFTPGDGMNTADQYVLTFSEPLKMVDLKKAVGGSADIGTLQPGANKVVADALDDLGNRAFDTQMFAAGNVLSPAESAAIAAQVESKLKPLFASAYKDFQLTASQDVANAFVAGVEKSAVDKIFGNACSAAATEFRNRIESSIRGMDLGTIHVDPDCSCSVTAHLVLRDIIVTGDPDCYSDFRSGAFDGVFELPNFVIVIGAYKRCQANGIFGECFYRTTVDVEARTYINDPVFKFTITEEGIETNTAPTDDMKTFVIGSLRYPGSVAGESLEGNIYDNGNPVWVNNSGTACWGAGVCSFFEGLTGLLIEAVTFGLVDATDVFDFINISWDLVDFQDLAGSSKPDPVSIGDIAIDSQKVEEFGQATVAPELADVTITPDGLTAEFAATFTTQSTDPDVEPTPGAALTPASAPGLPQGVDPQNAFMVLADDTINQLFASMAQSGGLKTICMPADPPKTVSSLLPDCATLTGETDLATATIQGYCHGMNGDDCEALTGSTSILQQTKQGVCHGVQGHECSTIPVEGLGITEKAACNITPKANVQGSDPLLFCAKQSIPPQFLITEEELGVPKNDLGISVLLNDLTVAIVVDRPANGSLDGQLSGIPNCFSADAALQSDCYLYTACVDITIDAGMSLDNPPNPDDRKCKEGETGFVFSVSGLKASGIESGVMCGGAATQTADTQVTDAAAGDASVDEITANVEYFTPPLCIKGLSLGGVLNFTTPQLMAIKTNTSVDYADYFGIIGEVK